MKISKYKDTGGPAYPSIVSNNTENNLIGFEDAVKARKIAEIEYYGYGRS